MKYVIVILPMVLASFDSYALKLEHVPMDKMNFETQSTVKNYKDWIVTKIPSKNKNSVTNYRLDIKVARMDRKKFNLYNYRFNGDPTSPYHANKTYKAENFLPSFLVSKSPMPTKQRLSETNTLSNTVHWVEWRTGNQRAYLKDSLSLPTTEVSPQLFEKILAEYAQETNVESLKTGDFLVVYGTDDIDQIQMPVASYVYIGNGVVLESKKTNKQSFSKFVYLKDVQSHFKNRMMDYRLRSFKILTKKALYLTDFIKDSGEPDLNLDQQASAGSDKIL